MLKRVIAIVLDSLGFDVLLNTAFYEIFSTIKIACSCSITKKIYHLHWNKWDEGQSNQLLN